jgi:hypothetical protein
MLKSGGTMKRPLVVLLAFGVTGGALAADRLPAKEGQCALTTIKKVGPRLEGIPDGTPDAGNAVSYTDGGYQESYMTIPGLKGSRVGDRVDLCLISVPDDCPPGDDRGKVYKATNLRTHQSWTAPNSEHDCGGA